MKNNRPNTAFYSSNEISQYIREANSAQIHLREFITFDFKDTFFISLGENCSSAWYLKQIGLKKASYPFDWIFSTPEIVLDCVNDNFEKFLNKSMITPKNNRLSAGHKHYHSHFFPHRNPLNSDNDYNYYKRCCDRFLNAIYMGQNVVYIITLINEPEKRKGWAKGFTQNFMMPTNQNSHKAFELINSLKSKNNNSSFIIVDHYTNCSRKVRFETIDESIFFIKFSAGGSSTGVYYQDQLDDFCFKFIMTGLHKST